MDEEIDYYFRIEKEYETEEEVLLVAEKIMHLQIEIGHIPSSEQYELIKLN
jgi:hypothetical protein